MHLEKAGETPQTLRTLVGKTDLLEKGRWGNSADEEGSSGEHKGQELGENVAEHTFTDLNVQHTTMLCGHRSTRLKRVFSVCLVFKKDLFIMCTVVH